MKTVTKTIEVVDSFTVEAYVKAWSVDRDSMFYKSVYEVEFMNKEGLVFTLPVNEDFIAQLKPGGNQKIQMEIKILDN